MSPKKTPLYQCHVSLVCQMVEFAHTMLPVRYTSEKDEHLAVRHHVGMFDISHMGEFIIEGLGAAAFLQEMLTNNIDRLAINQAHYTLMLNQQGGIIDDLIVYRLAAQKYLLCVNAANIEKDFAHLSKYASSNPGLTIKNASEDYALIAVQGPKSESLLRCLTDDEIPKRYYIHELKIAGIATLTARTGYTGEDGFEIFVAAHNAKALWQCFIERGQAFNLKPCGLAARDSLRLEAGLLLHGQDMDETTTPREARLMFAVDMKKPSFMGKDALVKQQEQGVTKRLMPFILLDRGIARHGFKVFDQHHNEIGVITSGTLPPEKPESCGFAYIPAALATPGQQVLIDIRGRYARAQLVSK